MNHEYNKEEETTFRTELFRRLDKQDTMLDKIEDHTNRTNGRVTKLEEKTSDYSDYKKIVLSLKGWKTYVAGMVVVIIFGGGFTIKLLVSDIYRNATEAAIKAVENEKANIANEVVSTIEQKYDLQVK